MLFAFDRKRAAILLVGGDKSKSWKGWYKTNIPIADDRFDEHQAKIARRSDSRQKSKVRRPRGRGKR